MSRVPWKYRILGALRQGEADLAAIYEAIEEAQDELEGHFLNPRLLENEPRWGNRPKYQHTVRGCMSALKKQGLVEWVASGRYRITNAGKQWLQEYE